MEEQGKGSLHGKDGGGGRGSRALSLFPTDTDLVLLTGALYTSQTGSTRVTLTTNGQWGSLLHFDNQKCCQIVKCILVTPNPLTTMQTH